MEVTVVTVRCITGVVVDIAPPMRRLGRLSHATLLGPYGVDAGLLPSPHGVSNFSPCEGGRIPWFPAAD